MAKINSAIRLNRRHLLLQDARRENVEKAIMEGIGVLGWAKAAPVFLTIGKDKKLVLSVERSSVLNIRASLEIHDKPIKVIRVSGTLKGLGKA